MKIVSFSIYPIDAPQHGGQRRSAAIAAALRDQGHDHCHISVEHPQAYAPGDTHNRRIKLPTTMIADLARKGLRQDVHVSSCFDDDALFVNFCTAILDHKPDVLWFEQPWLWPVVKRAKQMFASLANTLVVYSSQNAEFSLLDNILGKDPQVSDKDRALFCDQTRALEFDLVNHADIGISTTNADDGLLFSQSDAPRFIVKNGINQPVKFSAQALPSEMSWASKHVTFVGSQHPPNATGFFEMMGTSLGFLNPKERMIIAGGVGTLIQNNREFHLKSAVNLSRCAILGAISDESLAAVLDASDVMIIPITEGGGSNLKTAEALLSGKPIVATPKAFVGYEEFMGLPQVEIAETRDTFRNAVKTALAAPALTGVSDSEDVKAMLQGLLWEQRTAPIVEIARTCEALLAERNTVLGHA